MGDVGILSRIEEQPLYDTAHLNEAIIQKGDGREVAVGCADGAAYLGGRLTGGPWGRREHRAKGAGYYGHIFEVIAVHTAGR